MGGWGAMDVGAVVWSWTTTCYGRHTILVYQKSEISNQRATEDIVYFKNLTLLRSQDYKSTEGSSSGWTTLDASIYLLITLMTNLRDVTRFSSYLYSFLLSFIFLSFCPLPLSQQSSCVYLSALPWEEVCLNMTMMMVMVMVLCVDPWVFCYSQNCIMAS